MTGVLNQMLAREHTLDLLCEGERRRAARGCHAETSRLRRALVHLLVRCRSRPERL